MTQPSAVNDSSTIDKPKKHVSITPPLDGRTHVRLQNILVATDFSSASDAALNHALSVARLYDAQIYVAHVIRTDSYELVPPGALPTIVDQIRRSAEQNMADLLISGRLRGVPHQVLLAEGKLWPVLDGMIQKHDIDLIVVGTHGRTGVRKLLLGSVAEEIFRMATCPVLTVGPRVSEKTPAESALRRVLYATDFSPTSERGAAYAFSLAQEHQARLTMLHVVREDTPAAPENGSRMREYFLKRLHQMVPPGAELWCDPQFAIEFGEPADEIMKAATEMDADLIVLGVRRSATFAGHLPPATAYKVVCQAHCPVLTVRG